MYYILCKEEINDMEKYVEEKQIKYKSWCPKIFSTVLNNMFHMLKTSSLLLLLLIIIN